MTAALKIASESLPAAAQPAPRGVEWLDVQTAAARLSCSEQRIRQRCAEEWLAIGLAKQRPPEGGGKLRWLVRADADPMLARVLAPDLIPFDLRTLTPAQRERVLKRRAILDEWERMKAEYVTAGRCERDATKHFLSILELRGETGASRRTLFRWSEDAKAGLGGLVDGRSRELRGEAAPPADDPFLKALRELWLTPNRLKVRQAHQIASKLAANNGWTVRSYHVAKRHLRALPTAVKVRFREGEKAYVAKAEPSIARDYSTLHTNELWCGDHHQMDVICEHQGKQVRPWLTAWQDVRSRKIVGWCIYAHDPNQNSVLSALRGGCLSHGVPVRLYVDNGKDFDSYAFHGRTKWERHRVRVVAHDEQTRGLLKGLGCDTLHAWPYHGQSKPVERFFGTLEDRFGRLWPTYCGNKPENKPETLAGKLERGQAPKLADFVARFAEWLEQDYHAAPHAGDGMDGRSPAAAYDASWADASKRTATEEYLDLLLMKHTQPLRVTKNGVRWGGLQYGQNHGSLFKWEGKEVFLRVDERDVSRVLVFSPDDRFICAAPCNRRLPANATEEQLREAVREKRQHKKRVREYVEARPKLHQDLPELMISAAAARNAQAAAEAPPPVPAGPASIKPVQTPLTDQLPALRRALKGEQLRPAVGAESMSFRDCLPFLEERRREKEATSDIANPWQALAEAFRREDEAKERSTT